MWKRLSRLWKKADAAASDIDRDMRLARAPIEETAYEAPAEADPIVLALERFDEELAQCGTEAVVGHVRELLLRAPTDQRVLRRAAALSRELGDEGLAALFEQGATSSSGDPLAEVGHAFLAMDDAELALTLGDGALVRAVERARRGRVHAESEGDGGLAAGRLVGALALSRMGAHERVLERLGGALEDGIAARVRWALAAIAVGDWTAWTRVAGRLGPAEPWVEAVRARVEAFPAGHADEGEGDPQRLLFSLYGTVLLDDAGEGERLEPERLVRWMEALATLVKELLPAGTRPAWVSPRGEVLARWLGGLLPEEASMPLSARLPKQPVIVMLADDADLATVCESKGFAEGELPMFQAVKDPGEIGSPMADVIGAFRAGVHLPLEGLEAERAADRLPPRMVVGQLQDEAQRTRVEPGELAGFLAWVRARARHLSLTAPPSGAERIPLDVARDV